MQDESEHLCSFGHSSPRLPDLSEAGQGVDGVAAGARWVQNSPRIIKLTPCRAKEKTHSSLATFTSKPTSIAFDVHGLIPYLKYSLFCLINSMFEILIYLNSWCLSITAFS